MARKISSFHRVKVTFKRARLRPDTAEMTMKFTFASADDAEAFAWNLRRRKDENITKVEWDRHGYKLYRGVADAEHDLDSWMR